MKLQNLIGKLKILIKDFGKIGGIAGVTTVLPSVGSMILLLLIYQISPWLQGNKELGIPFFVAFMTIFSGAALIATNMPQWHFESNCSTLSSFVCLIVGITSPSTTGEE